jgi:alanyl-tRNA synthetase
MTVRELREKFLRFYESKGHLVHASGSLVPVDVTGKLDESLLFNGAGMVQFKPYFRGVATPPSKRVTTSQKCVRTGDIDEVGDDSHLTFFEMLGNFSFGDYFKEEAITFSWEFLTSPEWLGLDPHRLSFTVFQEDDDAYNYWAGHLSKIGIDPATRVFRLDEETNYWPAGAFSKGPPGPCGPNSEMFYWTSSEPVPGTNPGDYDRDAWIRDDEAKNWLEIWNDVFIQYEWQGTENPGGGYTKTGMPGLPFVSIDTGSGIERTVAVLNGYKSVYKTDAFTSIFDKLDLLGAPTEGEDVERARRIIADHIRTACFCIGDGILPANNGRGYVLRRLIRRAVLKGQRTLGFGDVFLFKVAEAVFDTFGDHYAELIERREIIEETLRSEEVLFRRTLARGSDLLAEELTRTKGTLAGEIAFQLYDTFGFPLEVTQELCAEAGVTVDLSGYQAAMAEAQERSRGAQGEKSAYGDMEISEELATSDAPAETEFKGYQAVQGTATLVRIQAKGEGRYRVALDKTPFYGESGGQTGDTGELVIGGQSVIVENTTKSAGTFWHDVIGNGIEDLLGKSAEAFVDQARRARIQRNHTATHLLQAALRQTLGTHVTQAGSYVGPENLRFDFTHGKGMTPAEIAEVERIVNEEALRNTTVTTYVDLPIDEARAKGAMALFGEKYGDRVRMVEIGEFSKELCGGTHVRSTGEIGLFKIVSESSAASGVRRIEAITGETAYAFVREETERVRDAATLLKASPKELVQAVERALEQLKDERKRREKAEMAAMSGGTATTETVDVKGVTLWVKNFGDADPKVASQAIDNEANGKPNQVTLGAIVGEKITFMCKVGADAQARGAHAGNLLREVAKVAGGGGGGQAAFATAGGRDASKVDEALAGAAEFLGALVS